jgi:hypothetical protein
MSKNQCAGLMLGSEAHAPATCLKQKWTFAKQNSLNDC